MSICIIQQNEYTFGKRFQKFGNLQQTERGIFNTLGA